MNKNWEIKNLKEVCNVFSDGNWIESKDQSPEGIRLVQTGNVGFGFFKDKKDKAKYISEKTFRKLKCTEVFPDDLLVSRLPDPVGKSCIIPNINSKMITAVDCTIIRTNKSILPEFLLYFQMSDEYLKDVSSKVTGTTRSRISRKNLGIVKIPLPPLPEQKRIVAILDKAFSAINKAKQNAEANLKNAKEMFESYLQNVFDNKSDDWVEKKLGEVLQKTETVNPKLKPEKEFIYLDVSSVNKETKKIEKITTLLGQDAPSRARKLVKTNDVIFATVRPTHSRVSIISDEFNNQVCSTGYYVLRPKDFLNSKFIYYFLLTFGFNEQMKKLQKGASYPAVTNKEVESRIIPFPKLLEKQKQIVQKLDTLSAETKKLETIYQQKIKDLEELKKSILSKAFRGEL